jgi:hypothetical protein
MAILQERQPMGDWSDRQSNIWEVQLEGQGPHASRRIALGLSSWSPYPIGGSTSVLRWQVATSNGSSGSDVKILGMSLDPFSVKELLAAERAFEIGHHGDRIFLSTSEGQRVLDRKSGSLVPQVPKIKLLASSSDQWLVQANQKTCMLDPSTGRITKTFSQIPADLLAALHRSRRMGRRCDCYQMGRVL